MSAFHINPEPCDALLRFSAVVTWGISPMVLGEKAHCSVAISAVSFRSTNGEVCEVFSRHALTSVVKICPQLVVKGESRAKALGRGLRKVSFGRQIRKPMAATAGIPPLAVMLFAVTVFIAAAPAFAATHPVPLDKNTDAKKCLECHEDKAKGKAVHSAIQMGCLSCHEMNHAKAACDTCHKH